MRCLSGCGWLNEEREKGWFGGCMVEMRGRSGAKGAPRASEGRSYPGQGYPSSQPSPSEAQCCLPPVPQHTIMPPPLILSTNIFTTYFSLAFTLTHKTPSISPFFHSRFDPPRAVANFQQVFFPLNNKIQKNFSHLFCLFKYLFEYTRKWG